MKSPLTDNPLRNPGESLDKRISKFIDDEILTYFLVSIVIVILASMEWVRWYLDTPPSPIVYSFFAIISVAYTTIKIIRGKSKLRSLRQGRDGEKAVGQYLEKLREQGVQLFHDIPSKGFNLDHVLICQSGIYVIETKTYSKPDKGVPKIVYNGKSVLINGKTKTEKPIIQVKAAAGWLAETLFESTGHKFMIKPVVLFPGWYIEPTSEAKSSEVWVLNPKALPAFIKHSKELLKPEEVKMASFHLSRYIRSYSE